jgi:hypothetical protein
MEFQSEIVLLHRVNMEFHFEIILLHSVNMEFQSEIVLSHSVNIEFQSEIILVHSVNMEFQSEIALLYSVEIKFQSEIMLSHSAEIGFQSEIILLHSVELEFRKNTASFFIGKPPACPRNALLSERKSPPHHRRPSFGCPNCHTATRTVCRSAEKAVRGEKAVKARGEMLKFAIEREESQGRMT